MSEKDYAKKLITEYSDKEPSKINDLIALDNKVKKPAYIFAYTFGIIASLILGVGMCLAMQVIGDGIGLMILGIVVGVIGIIMVSINYPIFVKILKHRKDKYSEEIIALSNKILNQ